MSVTAIEHVLVLSDDIERTRDFYCEVVGLEVGDRPPLAFPGYWLYAGAGDQRLRSHRRAPTVRDARRRPRVAGPRARPGPIAGPVDHVAFNASDYDELLERLKRSGVAAVTNVVPGGPRQVFIEDPNGVRVEINVKD